MPWLTCFENVYLAVERVFDRSESKEKLKARTKAALALVGLAHAEQKRPHEISCGMLMNIIMLFLERFRQRAWRNAGGTYSASISYE